jgi:predicted HTH transcriptional regulator
MNEHKIWINKAKECLKTSLSPIPHELNELDWKLDLSDDSTRIAQHISAFGNLIGGGFFAFGLSSNAEIIGIAQSQTDPILRKLANIARDAMEPPQKIDHFVDDSFGKNILFVHILESDEKPVHIHGKGMEFSFIRSGGQTRKMSRQELATAVMQSRQVRYEELEALKSSTAKILELIDYDKFFKMLNVPLPGSQDAIVEELVNHKIVYRNNDNFSITNLGAITAAKNFLQFPGKERFSVRVIRYKGTARIETEMEKEFIQGYGVGFQELIRYIVGELPASEVIQDALRKNVPVYPEITIRELVANALIHRDFTITNTNPMVEIFSDRMEILNPGRLLPTVKVDRLIDAVPESRNELFAGLMRRMGVCEERGSGIDKALFAVEVYGLPPVKFIEEGNFFKVILYAPRTLRQMTLEERLRACYQHCCLKHVSGGEKMTNTSFRKRLALKDAQYALAWRIIDTALEQNIIKPVNPESKSRKYAAYIPFWA